MVKAIIEVSCILLPTLIIIFGTTASILNVLSKIGVIEKNDTKV